MTGVPSVKEADEFSAILRQAIKEFVTSAGQEQQAARATGVLGALAFHIGFIEARALNCGSSQESCDNIFDVWRRAGRTAMAEMLLMQGMAAEARAQSS